MPVVVHDSDAPKSQRKAFVGTNNVEAGKPGRTGGDRRAQAANISKGKVAMFVGRIDMQNSIDRKRGIDETLGKQPGIEILPIFLDGADRNKAKKNVEDALARYPDLVMVDRAVVVQRPRDGRRRGKLDAREEAAGRRVRRGRRDAEGGRGRHHLRHHRPAPVPVRLPVDEGAEGRRDGKTIPTFIDTTIQTIDKSNLATFWAELREMKK